MVKDNTVYACRIGSIMFIIYKLLFSYCNATKPRSHYYFFISKLNYFLMGLPQNQKSLFQGTSDPELSSEWQKKAPKKESQITLRD